MIFHTQNSDLLNAHDATAIVTRVLATGEEYSQEEVVQVTQQQPAVQL